MSDEKVMEKEKILQVVEKYRDYFNEWDADVAFGVHGKNIFYVLASGKEFEAFLFFRTADQLERIILGTIAENLDVVMDAGIDEVYVGFTADDVDEKSDKSIEYLLAGSSVCRVKFSLRHRFHEERHIAVQRYKDVIEVSTQSVDFSKVLASFCREVGCVRFCACDNSIGACDSGIAVAPEFLDRCVVGIECAAGTDCGVFAAFEQHRGEMVEDNNGRNIVETVDIAHIHLVVYTHQAVVNSLVRGEEA